MSGPRLPDDQSVGPEATAGFSPEEPTDGRIVGNWDTRYPITARRRIRIEAVYLALIFLLTIASSVLTVIDLPVKAGWLDTISWEALKPMLLGLLGGAIGGVLFATKWLYHTVAKGIWNSDRRLWRLFTPMLASGVAFAMVTLIIAGVVPLFGRELITTDAGSLGVAILVGYFSDRAFSMLEAMATQQFGSPRGQRSK